MQLTFKIILVFGFISWGSSLYIGDRDDPSTKDARKPASGTDEDKTDFHIAAEEGNLEEVRLHLNNLISASITDSTGKTPLHYAAENGHTEVAELLIEAGADVNVEDRNRATPLIYASINGHLDTMEMLIKKGADINVMILARRRMRLTILHWAATDAEIENREKVADVLISHGVNVNAMDSKGRTALMVAIEHEQPAMVDKLIKNGANVNLADGGNCKTSNLCRGGTALHWAVNFGNNDIVEMLTKNGANVNAKDDDGKTPLDIATAEASRWSESTGSNSMHERYTEIIETLKNAGASE